MYYHWVYFDRDNALHGEMPLIQIGDAPCISICIATSWVTCCISRAADGATAPCCT